MRQPPRRRGLLNNPVRYNLWLPIALKQQIAREAERRGLPPQDFLRKVISEAVKAA